MMETKKSRKPMLSPILAACGSFLFALGGCKTVNVEVLIAARPATVWKVVSDASGYQDWNPVHVKFEGVIEEGASIKIHLKEPGGKVNVFSAKVKRVIPELEMNQGGGIPGFFTFNHSFHLEPFNGGTRLTQREEFRGVGVLFYEADWVEEAYNTVNAAIKKRAESMEKTN